MESSKTYPQEATTGDGHRKIKEGLEGPSNRTRGSKKQQLVLKAKTTHNGFPKKYH